MSPKFIKLIAIILILALYFFAAHHIYTQELFGLPERSGKGIRTSMTFFILQPLTALITSFFIFAFESNTDPFPKRVEKVSFENVLKNPVKLLEILGNLSYGIYLWHLPIITKITPIITATIPLDVFYAKSTYVIFCSTLLAAITYYLVEIPFSKLKIVSNF